MARNDKAMNSKSRAAIAFTALMGVAIAAISIFESKYGTSDVSKMLSFIALVGVMLGGVAVAFLMKDEG
jgi:hypothetical protein